MRRFGRTIVTAALAVAVVTGTAGWAAAGESRQAVTGPPPEAATWRAGNGADPVSAAFGARPVPAADVAGHTGYSASGSPSPAAFAAISEGEVR